MNEIYTAFAANYNLLQGRQSRHTWMAGVGSEVAKSDVKFGHVFDAGAGTGIGAQVLKQHGQFHVTSCDRSWPMLKQAATVSDEILHADLSNLPEIERRFDFVTSGFDALNYLSPAQLANFFHWSRTHLKDRGLLIYDYSSPYLIEKEWQSVEYYTNEGDITIRWKHRYDTRRSCGVIGLTCSDRHGDLWTETHEQYTMGSAAMGELAESIGLRVLRALNLSGESYTDECRTHVYVLAKR